MLTPLYSTPFTSCSYPTHFPRLLWITFKAYTEKMREDDYKEEMVSIILTANR